MFQGSPSFCPPPQHWDCRAAPPFLSSVDAGDLNVRHQANTAGTVLTDHLPRLTSALSKLLLVLLYSQRVASQCGNKLEPQEEACSGVSGDQVYSFLTPLESISTNWEASTRDICSLAVLGPRV